MGACESGERGPAGTGNVMDGLGIKCGCRKNNRTRKSFVEIGTFKSALKYVNKKMSAFNINN